MTVHVLCETDDDVHAVGREQHLAAAQGRPLLAGASYQVIRVRPGAVPQHGAQYGGQVNPACVWCSGAIGEHGSPGRHCACLVPCAARACGAAT